MGDREFGLDPTASTPSRRRSSRFMRRGSRSRSSPAAGTSGADGRRGRGDGPRDADYAGMLAIVLNSLVLQDALERRGAQTRVLSALAVSRGRRAVHPPPRDPPSREGPRRHLRGGTGNPSSRATRPAHCARSRSTPEAILMAKHGVEGVYDGDPEARSERRFLPELTHAEAIERDLKVMDATALSLCRRTTCPSTCSSTRRGNIRRVLSGERLGTIISTGKES